MIRTMTRKKQQPEAELSFEESLDRLEGLIDRVESGEVGLEEALEHHAQGTKLVQRCRAILETAERRIAELSVNGDGDLTMDGESDDE